MFTPLISINRTLTTAARCKRRVVITGMGVVCPLGVGVQNAWQALIDSKSGVIKFTEPDYDKLPCKVGKIFMKLQLYYK